MCIDGCGHINENKGLRQKNVLGKVPVNFFILYQCLLSKNCLKLIKFLSGDREQSLSSLLAVEQGPRFVKSRPKSLSEHPVTLLSLLK